MIRRETNPEIVNEMLRRDWPDADYSEVLAEPLHICLVEGDSGAIFAWRGPGIYEAHVFFAVRGRQAFNLALRFQEAIKELGARKLWSLIPESDRKICLFLRQLGWSAGDVLTTRDGPKQLFTMELETCRQ